MRGKAGIPLLNQLKIIDPNVQTEVKFDWLFLPNSTERTTQENEILTSLWNDCKKRAETKFKNKFCDYKSIYYFDSSVKGRTRTLEYDFYLPNFNLLIELDEKQHFTKERAITFEHYRNEDFLYNIDEWCKLCLLLKKKDSDKETRDWQRAFRDAVRDIRARANGFPLIRLYISEVNKKAFENFENCIKLRQLIEQKSEEGYKNTIENNVHDNNSG